MISSKYLRYMNLPDYCLYQEVEQKVIVNTFQVEHNVKNDFSKMISPIYGSKEKYKQMKQKQKQI